MANEVKTIFTVDARQAFSEADRVKAAYASTDREISGTPTVLKVNASQALDQVARVKAAITQVAQQASKPLLLTTGTPSLAGGTSVSQIEKLRANAALADAAFTKAAASKNALFSSAGNISAGIDKVTQDLARNTAAAALGGNKVWSTYGAGAAMVTARYRDLSIEIAKIRAEAARTTDPASLKILNQRLTEAGIKADALYNKMNRVNAGRIGAAGGGPISSGTMGRAASIANAGAQMGIPLAGEVSSALSTAADLGIKVTGSMLGLIGVGAAAILATKLVTDQIAKGAERRLRSEEKISIEYGRQQKLVHDMKVIQFELTRDRAAAVKNDTFAGGLSGIDTNRLQGIQAQRLAEITMLQNQDVLAQRVGKSPLNTFRIGELTKELGQVDAALKSAEQSTKDFFAAADSRAGEQLQKRLSDVSEQVSSAGKDVAKLREIRTRLGSTTDGSSPEGSKIFDSLTKEIASLVKEGKEKVKELQKGFRDVFTDLTRQKFTNNPFVGLFLDADAAMTKLRENTRGLDKELVNTFENIQRQQNALKLFEAKVDSKLEVSDLRQQAKEFRSGTKGEVDSQYKERIEGTLEKLGFDLKNLDNASLEQKVSLARTASLNNLYGDAAQDLASKRQSLSSFGVPLDGKITDSKASLEGARFNGVALDTLSRGTAALLEQQKASEETTQQRLDRQLQAAGSISPENEAERASADRRIAALGSGADAGSLNQSTRNQVADAMERDAVRRENAEQKALEVAVEMLGVQKEIAKNGARLMGIAQKQGIKGIELEVIAKDETEKGANVKQMPKRPTAQDTADLYGGLDDFYGARP